jgi:hypothetical protein
MSRTSRAVGAIALLGLALAGCTEAPRTGSVWRTAVPFGPWFLHPGVYDRPLALGRPKVVVPPEDATSPGAAGSPSSSAGSPSSR